MRGSSAVLDRMTPSEVALIRASWTRVFPIAEQAAELFYTKLFAAEPELRYLFTETDMAAQRRKLVAALALVVRSVDDLPALRPTLESLGERHLGYGVQERDYATVGGVLIATLQAGLGDHFTPETSLAWQKAYHAIAAVMISGAREVV